MKDPTRTDHRLARETAVLVGVILPERAGRVDPYDPLKELHALADAAGAIVVDKIIQRRERIDPAGYVGKGKLEEIARRVEQHRADVVIFDNELSPSQIREIEAIARCKVLDRTELILDIFASRARTHAARLQVELAQLQYTAPRLRGMWTHLERIAGAGGGTKAGAVGGIGTRGPGERQIEIDRRIVQRRMTFLRQQLAGIDRRKLREVKARSDYFQVSLVGYTNAGKSTLMNALTDAGAYVEDKLFATLDTLTRRWDLGGGQVALLSDTVGFVRDLPHHLVASFRATLEETLHADLLMHVVDASAADAAEQIGSVEAVLAELGCADTPTVVVLNKIDALTEPAALTLLTNRKPRAVPISARTGAGVPELVQSVIDCMRGRYVRARLEAEAANGKLLAYLSQYGHVLNQSYNDGVVQIDTRLPRAELGRVTALGARVLELE